MKANKEEEKIQAIPDGAPFGNFEDADAPLTRFFFLPTRVGAGGCHFFFSSFCKRGGEGWIVRTD